MPSSSTTNSNPNCQLISSPNQPQPRAPIILEAYKMGFYTAPNRCERKGCDVDLPTAESRYAHMKETNHFICGYCDEYVKPGHLTDHYWQKHPNDGWNDHGVEFADRVAKDRVMPWVVLDK